MKKCKKKWNRDKQNLRMGKIWESNSDLFLKTFWRKAWWEMDFSAKQRSTGKNKMADTGLQAKGLISGFELSLFGPISLMTSKSWWAWWLFDLYPVLYTLAHTFP